jgi:Tfp pilus assembly protein PilV
MRSRNLEQHLNGQVLHGQDGMSLVELLVASVVMIVGLLGAMILITTTIANNNRNKWDSTATLLAQMTMEKIASVPANSGSTVTIVDCNPSSSSASHSVNTVAGGAPLTSTGDIDFTQPTVTGYAMTYYNCQWSTGQQQELYDVRWNVTTISASAKLVTVAARTVAGPSLNANFFQQPVSLKMIVGP